MSSLPISPIIWSSCFNLWDVSCVIFCLSLSSYTNVNMMWVKFLSTGYLRAAIGLLNRSRKSRFKACSFSSWLVKNSRYFFMLLYCPLYATFTWNFLRLDGFGDFKMWFGIFKKFYSNVKFSNEIFLYTTINFFNAYLWVSDYKYDAKPLIAQM